MAWFMDTYSMHMRQHTPGVVTGKPLEIGGSRGRVEATGRGVSLVALDEMKEMGLRPANARVVVQGFGNVGSYAAKMFAERGCRVVGISDVTGGYYNAEGIDVGGAIAYVARASLARRLRGGEQDHQRRAARDASATCSCRPRSKKCSPPKTRGEVKAKLIVEGANGPTTPEADRIFKQSGIVVIPDIIANAGGVIVSYFEWVQDRRATSGRSPKSTSGSKTCCSRTSAKCATSRARARRSLRTAAYTLAIDRVVKALKIRGIYA